MNKYALTIVMALAFWTLPAAPAIADSPRLHVGGGNGYYVAPRYYYAFPRRYYSFYSPSWYYFQRPRYYYGSPGYRGFHGRGR